MCKQNCRILSWEKSDVLNIRKTKLFSFELEYTSDIFKPNVHNSQANIVDFMKVSQLLY